MNTEMDVIIPLSRESLLNKDVVPTINKIRSYLPASRIIIASHVRPDFLEFGESVPKESVPDSPDSFEWVRSPDLYPNKDANQIDAIISVLITCGISKQFLRCSDDEELISDHPLPIHAGPIVVKDGGRWQRRLNNTAAWLSAKGFPTLNYDTHTPKIYDRDKFFKVFSDAPYQGHCGLTIESTYFNQFNYYTQCSYRTQCK